MFFKNSLDISNSFPCNWRVFSFKTINSTNNLLKKYIRENTTERTEYTALIAQTQTQGRGRLNRGWNSNKGGLWISLCLTLDRVDPSITLVMGLALHRAVKKLFPELEFSLKWPNDLVSNKGIKIAGILCEAILQEKNFFIIGTGLNVSNNLPETIINKASSLKNICSKQNVHTEFFKKDNPVMRIALEYILQIDKLWPVFKQNGFSFFQEEYTQKLSLMTRDIFILKPGSDFVIASGKVLGVHCDGRLKVKLENNTIALFTSGEVTFQKPIHHKLDKTHSKA